MNDRSYICGIGRTSSSNCERLGEVIVRLLAKVISVWEKSYISLQLQAIRRSCRICHSRYYRLGGVIMRRAKFGEV